MKAGDYERLVRSVYAELLQSEGVSVYHLKKYPRRSSSQPIKVDVSFEVEVGGARVVFAIECKHYKKAVGVGDVDEFFAKLQDIGAHKGIIVTTVGFQRGAEEAAKGRGIALALLTDAAVPGELVYVWKNLVAEPTGVLRGNLKPWGALAKHKQGIRFDSSRDLVRALVDSMS